MKETLKQYVFRLMDEKGYVLDQDLAKWYKDKEINYYQGERYKRLWRNLQYFKDYEFTEFCKGNRKYLARTADMPKHQWHKIPKELYEELNKCK